MATPKAKAGCLGFFLFLGGSIVVTVVLAMFEAYVASCYLTWLDLPATLGFTMPTYVQLCGIAAMLSYLTLPGHLLTHDKMDKAFEADGFRGAAWVMARTAWSAFTRGVVMLMFGLIWSALYQSGW